MKLNKNLIKNVSFIIVTFMLSSCIGASNYKDPEVLPSGAQTKFTFDYKVDGVMKSELWKRARDYFAGAYGDSKSVFRVMDESDGTIIGKGTSSWLFGEPTNPYAMICYSDYHVRFAAKDNKARLQLEIINGVPALSSCKGWPLPTRQGYEEMKQSFISNSKALEKALRGDGALKDFKDF